MAQKTVLQTIREHLEGELGDQDLAQQLASVVLEQALTWTAPSTDLNDVGAIIGCSFGYQRLPNGNILPGPMNEKLAQVVVELYTKLGCKVYMQWEIAEAMGDAIPHSAVNAINPEINPQDATVKYLGTFGVLQKVLHCVGDPKSLGKVLIVAYRDHAPRCVATARKLGFDAFVPPIALPNDYDPQSGQAWTRNRHAYIIHDTLSRLEAYRAENIGTSLPSRQLD